jgi:hypothetical protein
MTELNQRGIALPVAIAALLTLAMVFIIIRGFLPGSDDAAAEQVADSVVAAEVEATPAQVFKPASAPTVEKPTIDPRLLSRLNSLIREGRRLVRDGRSQAMQIREADADAGLRTAAARAATQQWNRFVNTYSAQVTRYGQQLSQMAGGMGFDNPAYRVYQELSFMVAGLQLVGVNPASTTNIPMKYMRKSRFDTATYQLDEALRRLRDLQ